MIGFLFQLTDALGRVAVVGLALGFIALVAVTVLLATIGQWVGAVFVALAAVAFLAGAVAIIRLVLE